MTRVGSMPIHEQTNLVPLCVVLLAVLLVTVCPSAGAQSVLQITPGSIAVFAGGSGMCSMPSFARRGHVQAEVRRGGVRALAQGDGCPAATYANLQTSYDVKVDAAGNVYIVDYNSSLVRKVDTTGTISTFAGGGSGCSGQTDAIGDGCPASQAILNGPYGLAFDAGGDVFITEGGFVGSITPRVRKVAPDGTISTFAGTGVQDYSGDGGPATSATMEEPTGVATDANGNVYIVDLAANVVRKVDLNFKITTVAGGGTGCPAQTDAVGDGCPATNASLNNPYGITVDATGNLYIADTNNNRIRKVNAGTGIITTIAGSGVQGYSGDNGPATSAEFYYPERVVLDGVGNLYISDSFNNRIRKIDTSGTITTVAGGGSGCTFTPCSALEDLGSNGSGYPVGLGLDSLGNIYSGAGGQVEKAGPQGAMAFPTTLQGQSSAPQTFVFSNLGITADTLPNSASGYAITGNGDYAITGGTCLTSFVLAPGSTCTLQAVFTPVAAGERSAVITFTDASAGSPHTLTLYGQGNSAQSQTITFPAIANQTYGAGPVTLAATASSGLPVTYSIVSGPATVSGSTLAITGAGIVVVQAAQAGNATYAAATPVQQTFTVAKATLTVAASYLTRYTDQTNPPALTYMMSGFVPNDTQLSATTGQPALSSNAPANPPEGSYVITITAGTLASANYNFTFQNAFLSIVPPSSTTTTLSLSTATAAVGQIVTLTATVTTIEPLVPGTVTFVDSNGGVVGHAQIVGEYAAAGYYTSNATISRPFPPGTHSIVANYDGTPGYTASSSTAQPLTISGTEPSLTTLTAQANGTNPANSDLTATVFGSGPQTPGGTVNFNDLTAGTLLGAVTSSGTTSSFQMSQFSSGSANGQVVTGDFNGDGIVDLAVTDHGSVDILLGKPDGTYAAPASYAAGGSLQFLAIADFNTDGALDIAAGDYSTGGIAILFGNGDGTFGSPVKYQVPAPSDPYYLVAADFNGDGVPDLAIAQNNGQTLVTILMNDGYGNFLYPQSYGAGGSQGITVGDFNGDGNLDIAASTGSNVAVLLGKGDGTFQPQLNSPGSGEEIASADFNGDGKLDVALANSSTVVVALGRGDGTFNAPASYPVSTIAVSIVSADINHDGHPDIVASGAGVGSQGTSVLLGVGDGTFHTPQTYNAGGALGDIAVGDLNGDGMPDLVLSNPYSNQISVLLGGTVSSAKLANVAVIGAGQHTISASYVPGTGSIYAGSVSNSVAITAQPVTVASLLPVVIAAGTNGLTLTVNGTNFDSSAIVLANETTLSTTYISATQLTALVPAALLAQPGSIQIQVLAQDVASNAKTLTVVPDVVLTALTPTLAVAQSGATTITAAGANFTATTVLRFNGAALQTTVASATQLKAVVPAASLATAGTAQIAAYDPASGSQSAAIAFTILPSPSVVFTGPPTSPPATQPKLNFQLSQPYPIALAGTMTLAFQPSPGEPDDPSIQFAGGGRSFAFTLPANSNTTPTVQLQSGTVAGTITVTLTLNANGVNVTPSSIAPVVIAIPKSVPVITNQSIVRNGANITIYVTGYSSSRDMTNAYFDFTPAPGVKFNVSSFTVPVGTLFTGWFGSSASNQYGSTFTYFQTFTLNGNSSDVESVTVTLENGQGKSQQEVVQ